MTPFVVDANAINAFQKERVEKVEGEAHNAIKAIFKNDCIALDIGGLCEQEWTDCAAGRHPVAISDWIADQLAVRKIRLFELSSNECNKHLETLGLPQKDRKWVRLSVGCGGKKIVTEDIDFFDPSKKNANSSIKKRIKQSRKGACSKALGKVYGVSVMCLCHVEQEVAEP